MGSQGAEVRGLTVVSDDTVAGLKAQRKLLQKYIKSELKKDTDYGVIPGTGTKDSLFKPGAEKLAKLFQLGSRIVHTEKEVDIHQNFAMFTYRIEIYDLRSGTAIAQCEGSCNSAEKKYKTRKNYQDHGDGNRTATGREDTPIGDVMNTLQKMAQKRAYVGAVISAIGASDFLTQDIDDADDAAAIGLGNEPKRAKASIMPKATAARSQDQTQLPECCGKAMMVSQYDQKMLYCAGCKAKVPRNAPEGGPKPAQAPKPAAASMAPNPAMFTPAGKSRAELQIEIFNGAVRLGWNESALLGWVSKRYPGVGPEQLTDAQMTTLSHAMLDEIKKAGVQ